MSGAGAQLGLGPAFGMGMAPIGYGGGAFGVASGGDFGPRGPRDSSFGYRGPPAYPQPQFIGGGADSLRDLQPSGGDLPDNLDFQASAYMGEGIPNHSNLYVKNIPEDISEEQMEALFRLYGQVDSCRLVRNLKTGASRGYGFVRFSSVDEAMAAIKGLNGFTTAMAPLPLEVKFADSDAGPKGAKTPTGSTPSDNLYVRNLPPSWGETEVHSLFLPYGVVVETRLLNAGAGEARGMGALVRMSSVDQAHASIENLNGLIVPGGVMPVMVRYADTAEDKARRQQRHIRGPSRYSPYATPGGGSPPYANGDTTPPTSGHLSSSNSLPAGFEGFNASGLPDASATGNVQAANSEAPPPASWGQPQPQVPLGFNSNSWGMQLPTDAPANVLGQQLSTGPGSAGSSGLASLYVKNLPLTANKLFLYEKFAIYGAIASVKVLSDEATGTCKGVGFVNYVDYGAAQEAIRNLNGLKVADKLLHVSLQTHRTGPTHHRAGSGGIPASF